MSGKNSTERFSDRVENYVKFRPTYPRQVIEFMSSELGLRPESVVADVGSGTGISAQLFLNNKNRVYGIEPNDKMREAAEKSFSANPCFHSQKGTSEQTGLPSESVDFIVAFQAFHWFKPEPTRAEFRRILKKNGFVVLVWNDRKITGSVFNEKYEELINEFGTDYKQVKHTNIDEERLAEFLGSFDKIEFYNFQDLDFPSLLGRLASSSYAPNEGQPRFEEMRIALQTLFDRYQKNGVVRIDYDTKVFYSKLDM